MLNKKLFIHPIIHQQWTALGPIGDHGDPVLRHVVQAPRLVLDQRMDPIMVEISAQEIQHPQHHAIQIAAAQVRY